MRKGALAAIALLVGVVASVAQAHEADPDDVRAVRQATARYHSIANALADGFVPFSLDPNDPDVPTCFDSPEGGMGVHYVRNVDATIELTDPEALVYEVKPNGNLRLVAVEYVFPEAFAAPADNPTNIPSVLGHELHKHPTLPLYVLHAWIWKDNPSGLLADFNPEVDACPDN